MVKTKGIVVERKYADQGVFGTSCTVHAASGKISRLLQERLCKYALGRVHTGLGFYFDDHLAKIEVEFDKTTEEYAVHLYSHIGGRISVVRISVLDEKPFLDFGFDAHGV